MAEAARTRTPSNTNYDVHSPTGVDAREVLLLSGMETGVDAREASDGDEHVYYWDLRTRMCFHKAVDEGYIIGSALSTSIDSYLFAVGSTSGIVNLYNREEFSRDSKKHGFYMAENRAGQFGSEDRERPRGSNNEGLQIAEALRMQMEM
ncbi:hypothetical protein ACLOJK_040927 [Asimina triloba]